MKESAQVKFGMGSHYLTAAGVILIIEGQKCFDPNFPDEVWSKELLEEVARKMNEEIGSVYLSSKAWRDNY